MDWFYAQDGHQAGPVDDAELARMVAAGTVNASTLVWHSGLPDWQPYAQASAPVAAAGQSVCSQCGGIFPADEVVTLEGHPVCGACKPLLLQKLRQGVAPVPTAFAMAGPHYGGFWIRVAAAILDALIMVPVGILVLVGYYAYGASISGRLLLQLVSILVALAYDVFFVGRFGGTPGKLICNLRIVRSDGSRLTYGRAVGRFFSRILSRFTFFIGYIIVGFDEEKRALHDYVADTRVVYTR